MRARYRTVHPACLSNHCDRLADQRLLKGLARELSSSIAILCQSRRILVPESCAFVETFSPTPQLRTTWLAYHFDACEASSTTSRTERPLHSVASKTLDASALDS